MLTDTQWLLYFNEQHYVSIFSIELYYKIIIPWTKIYCIISKIDFDHLWYTDLNFWYFNKLSKTSKSLLDILPENNFGQQPIVVNYVHKTAKFP